MKQRKSTPSQPKRLKVLNIVTSSLTLRFFEHQAPYFEGKGLEVVLMSSPGKELDKAREHGTLTVAIPMVREISPLKDVISLWRTKRHISRMRPDITNVATPKAGFIGGIAAFFSRVPCRYYSLLGLRCETASGFKRRLLIWAERVSCSCAHRVICVSESLRRRAIELGVVDESRAVVLGSGGFPGVDPSRFADTIEAQRSASQMRKALAIPEEAPVVGFIGRLTKDKGVCELVDAFTNLRRRLPHAWLLLVGGFEEGDPVPASTRQKIQTESQIVTTGFVDDPAPYYRLIDVLAFPSHREGFGNVILEAHAAGKPVVAARATGIVDSVIDGTSGILVPIDDKDLLCDALERLLRDRDLAAALGAAGRERTLKEFRQDFISEALFQEYLRFLRTKDVARAALIEQRAHRRRTSDSPA